MSLKNDVYGLLNKSARLCESNKDAEELEKIIEKMKKRLNEPLRVAVVGMMKAGKSTFMNALIGRNILKTGNLETTYTVGWFKYGQQPALQIHFKDGSSLDAPFEDLHKWSTREAMCHNERIEDVAYVIIYYPCEVLKKMEFIDTPGLNSIYGTDEQNTLDFLSIKSSEDTLAEVSEADAIIYAFSRTAGDFDREILEAFQNGNTDSSPINSIGILTKADSSGIWDLYEENTPVESAQNVADKVMESVDISKQLFAVIPVCAKTATGLLKLSKNDFEALKCWAKFEMDDLRDYLFDSNMFATCEDDGYMRFGPAKTRAKVINCLGQYGIIEVVRQIKNGKGPQEIREILQQRCGINAVRKMLYSHFGTRTFLVKSKYIFNYLRATVNDMRRKTARGTPLYEICVQVKEYIDDFISSHQSFNELNVLQMYYNGQVKFDKEENEDFLRITGEYGRGVECRLGVDNTATISEMKICAKNKAALWNAKAAGWMQSNSYVTAATVISRSYEQIYFHLQALDEE